MKPIEYKAIDEITIDELNGLAANGWKLVEGTVEVIWALRGHPEHHALVSGLLVRERP